MSTLSRTLILFGLLTLSLAPAKRSLGQARDTTVSPPVDHSTMTRAQHSAMHGGAGSAKDWPDSAFAALQERGKMAMGIDQYKSAHQFDVLPKGGRIALEMRHYDSLAVAQIRAHLKLIQHAFQAGDFSTPEFVHMRAMPGTDVMSRKRALIDYTYADLPRGGEVRITTNDRESLAAIQKFMEAQRADHERGAGQNRTDE
jgi:hypothetical protein